MQFFLKRSKNCFGQSEASVAILDIESLQKVTKNYYRNSYGKSDDLKLFLGKK